MGGNALKNTYTRRYNKDEYLVLKEYIISKLRSHDAFKYRKINDIQAYKQKETFGDMDLLISSDNLPHNTWPIVKELLKPNQLVRNGSVTSLDVQELQVDLILAPDDEYDITAIYFSYNDLGNLIGRVAYNLGFKYGHNGLSYTVRDNNKNVVEEVNISKNPIDIFKFLGYDFKTYENGFNTLEDIFNFTITTEYFNKAYYNLESRNYASRIRDRKRATYRGFLEWIEQRTDLPEYDYINKKETHLQRAFNTFPEFKIKYEEAMQKYNNIQKRKEKFNGAMVSELTGLTNDLLGQWIQGYIKSKPNFNDWILNTSIDELKKDIVSKHKNNEIELVIPEKSIYGRDNVRTITGFDGRKLTMFMTDFRQGWPDKKTFYEWLSDTTPSEINETISMAASKFKYEP